MNPVHPADAHRAPRPERRTPTPRIGGQAPRGHGRGPGDEPGAHATGDRAPDDPSPGMQSTTTAGWADPRRAGPCAVPPTRLIPGAAAATPRPAGRAGPEDPAPARSVPARPRGRRATGPAAATIPRTTPSERPRRRLGPAPRGPGGNRWARSDSSKNPTTMTAGSSPRRAVEDPGRLRRAQQPDPDASTHRRTDRTGRSPPPRRMRRCPAPTRTPGRRRPPLPPGTRPPRGPPGAPPSAARSRRAPPRSRHQRRDRGAPSAILRPGPRPPAPQDRTIRPPRPPARTLDDPENDPPLKPRTASRRRHDPTPPHDHFRPPPEKHQALQRLLSALRGQCRNGWPSGRPPGCARS